VTHDRGTEAFPPFDPYAELGLTPGADRAAIEAAYRSLMKLHHPDVARDPVAGEQRGKRLNVARRWLTDPVLRRRYDDLHGVRRPVLRNAWEPPPTTVDDLLRVHYDRRSVAAPSPPSEALIAIGVMLALAAAVMGFRSGLAVVGGAAGVALAAVGALATSGRWRPAATVPGRPRAGRWLRSFPALLVVGLVFVGVGALLVSISIWLLVFALPALIAGAALVLYGGIGVIVGGLLAAWSRRRPTPPG
jgi:hypothetical protein